MIPPPNRPAGRATLHWVYFLSFALALCAPLARADNYGFIYADGNDFNAPDWFDSSTNPNMSNVGPPGPGDNATIGSGTVTCSGGAVESLSLLSGSNLQLSGKFTANTLADAGILSGNGPLTTQTLVGSFDIEGTNVVVGTSDAGGALNGGSLSINSYSGTSILAADGATLTIGNSLTDFNAGAATGASVTIPGIANGWIFRSTARAPVLSWISPMTFPARPAPSTSTTAAPLRWVATSCWMAGPTSMVIPSAVAPESMARARSFPWVAR